MKFPERQWPRLPREYVYLHLNELKHTPLKFNRSPLKSYHPKRKIIFQPSIFRGELLNFGGVYPYFLLDT